MIQSSELQSYQLGLAQLASGQSVICFAEGQERVLAVAQPAVMQPLKKSVHPKY